jgi:hypothetical protein
MHYKHFENIVVGYSDLPLSQIFHPGQRFDDHVLKTVDSSTIETSAEMEDLTSWKARINLPREHTTGKLSFLLHFENIPRK